MRAVGAESTAMVNARIGTVVVVVPVVLVLAGAETE